MAKFHHVAVVWLRQCWACAQYRVALKRLYALCLAEHYGPRDCWQQLVQARALERQRFEALLAAGAGAFLSKKGYRLLNDVNTELHMIDAARADDDTRCTP
jgi:hypothetical protein